MSLTYGFYNSLNGDRKYDAIQLSSMFDGLITDGVFASVGSAFIVHSAENLVLNVGTGRAWFNHTWTLNDDILSISAPESDSLLDRIDAVVLEINATNIVRENSIKVITGTPSSQPVRPLMTSSSEIHQYPLCYIFRKAGSESISQADITNMIGSSETPFVTGIIQTVSLDELICKWSSQLDKYIDDSTREVDELKSIVKNAAKSLVALIDITIPAQTWVANDNGFMQVDIVDERIGEKFLPKVFPSPAYNKVILDCELMNGCETGVGWLRLYSKRAPSVDIPATLALYNVSISSGSQVLTYDNFASETDVDRLIGDIFGSES